MKLSITRVPRALAVAALLTTLAACASGGSSSPDVSESPATAAPIAGSQLATGGDQVDPADVGRRREPDAVGVVASVAFGEDSVQVEFTPDAGYEYFAGTTFDLPFSAAFGIDGEEALVLGDLQAGDRINVWTSSCAESMPVQCQVEAVTAG